MFAAPSTETQRAVLAESPSVALEAAPVPSTGDVERAAAFTREPFVLEGEDAAVALAPGSARRRAFDAALAELDAGADGALGRLAPALVAAARPGPAAVAGRAAAGGRDGALGPPGRRAVRHAHRAPRRRAAQRRRLNGAVAPAEEPSLASAGLPGEEDLEDDDEPEEPQDWEDDAAAEAADEQLEEQPEDPNAAKRFWFEHATGAGKTVAALGFVEASRTGGTLILTHRRNLVDQFLGELRDRGYAKRIAPRCCAARTAPTAR